MSKQFLYALWGGLFILCAGLGFIPEPSGVLSAVMMFFSIVFFLPPAVLLYQAAKEKDIATTKLIRNLSALSLVLTMALLILNFLSAYGSEALGTVLYYILVIVTSPMICSGHWFLSMFLWACLLMTSLRELKQERPGSDVRVSPD